MAVKKPPHKAKASKTGRKYGRNFPGHTRSGHSFSKYVIRKTRNGTFKVRKSFSKRNTS